MYRQPSPDGHNRSSRARRRKPVVTPPPHCNPFVLLKVRRGGSPSKEARRRTPVEGSPSRDPCRRTPVEAPPPHCNPFVPSPSKEARSSRARRRTPVEGPSPGTTSPLQPVRPEPVEGSPFVPSLSKDPRSSRARRRTPVEGPSPGTTSPPRHPVIPSEALRRHPVIPSEASPPSSCHFERGFSAVIPLFRARPLRHHPVSEAKRSREIPLPPPSPLPPRHSREGGNPAQPSLAYQPRSPTTPTPSPSEAKRSREIPLPPPSPLPRLPLVIPAKAGTQRNRHSHTNQGRQQPPPPVARSRRSPASPSSFPLPPFVPSPPTRSSC